MEGYNWAVVARLHLQTAARSAACRESRPAAALLPPLIDTLIDTLTVLRAA